MIYLLLISETRVLELALKEFARKLLNWYRMENDRVLPWKSEKDAYKIWLSEIILQQTRAEQAIPYFQELIQTYPDVFSLAAAKEEDVFKLWQGLGYYNRCANMLKAAQKIVEEYKGTFPNQYEQIIELPGVGPYTAAAIASFAFDLPHAVVDGNVYRVLSRYFAETTPIDTGTGKKIFSELAQHLLPKQQAATFNQAIMDLGATVCTPKKANCDICPLQTTCKAYQQQSVYEFPVKVKKIQIQTRYFHYLILIKEGHIYMEKRSERDIWKNLFQPYLIETEKPKKLKKKDLPQQLQKYTLEYIDQLSQRLTHREIHSYWYLLNLDKTDTFQPGKGRFFTPEEIKKLALPKSIFLLMSKKNYFYPKLLNTN